MLSKRLSDGCLPLDLRITLEGTFDTPGAGRGCVPRGGEGVEGNTRTRLCGEKSLAPGRRPTLRSPRGFKTHAAARLLPLLRHWARPPALVPNRMTAPGIRTSDWPVRCVISGCS